MMKLILTSNKIYASIIFLTLVFSQSYDLSAQQKIETLKKRLSSTTNPIQKVQLQLELGDKLIDRDNQEALDYGYQALALSKEINDVGLEITALLHLFRYHQKLNQLEEANQHINQAWAKSKSSPKNPFLAKVYILKAQSFESTFQYDSVRYYTQKVLEVLQNPDYTMRVEIEILLGSTSMVLDKDYSSTYAHYLKALQLSEEHHYDNGIILATINIASCYYSLKNFEMASRYAQKCLNLSQSLGFELRIAQCQDMLGKIHYEKNKLDSANFFLSEAFDHYNSLQKKAALSSIHNYLGFIHQKKRDHSQAINQFKQAIKKDLSSQRYHSAFSYHAMAESYFSLSQSDIALQFLDSASRLSKKPGGGAQMNIDALYHKIYSERKEFTKAYFHHQRYIKRKDSIESITNQEQLGNLEASYQIKKKEDEIKILNAENTLKSYQLYSLVTFLILAIATLLFILNRHTLLTRTRKKLLELDQMKSRFFDNISQEFQSPINSILKPIQEELGAPNSPEIKNTLRSVFRNTKRLDNLIDQLQELSHLESKTISVAIRPFDVVLFFKIIFSNFSLLAESKGILYNLAINKEHHIGYTDFEKLQKIVVNLIANAFKFTSDGGQIELIVDINEEKMIVSVKDNGVGIAEENLDIIFDRFYQIDNSATRPQNGNGIGLALSRELCTLLHGTLYATSKKGKGSQFDLTLPISKSSFRAEEIVTSQVMPLETLEFDEELRPGTISIPIAETENNPIILVAEDNVDLQSFIAEIFKSEYQIIFAQNGTEAWERTLQKIPDIVISDYMMPEMNGIELCEKIKSHHVTSHIPVIILTAKVDQETKVEGLRNHVDVYLTKPFDIEELKLTVTNLIKERKRLKNILEEKRWESDIELLHIEGDQEKKFFATLMDEIDKNYTKVEFGVEMLATQLSMSRMQLHRKIKALTDQSPGDILRIYRLEKAKHLLLTPSELTIKDIAVEVGFNNQSNFAKTFREYTGLSPSDFMEHHSLGRVPK